VKVVEEWEGKQRVAVHSASIQDRDGAALVLDKRTRRLSAAELPRCWLISPWPK
jgi:hypothetical protein